MKIHDEHKRTGHLLSFTGHTRPEDNFTLFSQLKAWTSLMTFSSSSTDSNSAPRRLPTATIFRTPPSAI